MQSCVSQILRYDILDIQILQFHNHLKLGDLSNSALHIAMHFGILAFLHFGTARLNASQLEIANTEAEEILILSWERSS